MLCSISQPSYSFQHISTPVSLSYLAYFIQRPAVTWRDQSNKGEDDTPHNMADTSCPYQPVADKHSLITLRKQAIQIVGFVLGYLNHQANLLLFRAKSLSYRHKNLHRRFIIQQPSYYSAPHHPRPPSSSYSSSSSSDPSASASSFRPCISPRTACRRRRSRLVARGC